MKAVVLLDQVSFAYPTGWFGRPGSMALNGVSLMIPLGARHGLVGESGSGKSTLGRIVMGLLAPASGRVETCGASPHELSGADRRAFAHQAQIVFQDSAAALDDRMTLGASVAEGLHIQGMGATAANRKVAALFDRVGLPSGLLHRYPHEVSGGQRQRACIARALAMEPKLLVADEPVSALDVSVQAQVLDLFDELHRDLGLTLLFISHDLAVVGALCDTVSIMRQGQIIEEGATHDVLNAPSTTYAQELMDSVPGKGLGALTS